MFSASFHFGILGVLKLYSIATHTFALCSVPGFHDDLFEVTVEMRPSMFFCCIQLHSVTVVCFGTKLIVSQMLL